MSAEPQELPVVDHLDAEIIMHRDVHFGGQFPIMLHYYEQEGKGVRPEFNPHRILDLHKMEQTYKIDLREHLLSPEQKDRIKKAALAYRSLKEMYSVATDPHSPALKLADLILSEEEDPKAEIEAIVALKERLLPDLLQLVQCDDFYDPLFPGYGYTPELAARCLGLIGSSKAIIPLFERIAQVDFYIEDVLLEALKNIGESAKHFLIQQLTQLPLSDSNERAAVALIHFREDPAVASLSLKLMKEPAFRQSHTLMGYFIIMAEGLKGSSEAVQFCAMRDDTTLPKLLRDDISEIVKHWN